VVVIEHNPDVILVADYIIDLGLEGGEEGGEVVTTGTPFEIMKSTQSHTGAMLREIAGHHDRDRDGHAYPSNA
jgi:excinuclease ABC subunit A